MNTFHFSAYPVFAIERHRRFCDKGIARSKPRGFTLVELLVIIAIMAAMTTVSVLSIRAGQGAARMKGATRDIFASVRQARSVALVTGQPAIISYAETEIEGERSAKITITSAKLMSEGVKRAETLSGEVVTIGADDEKAGDEGEAPSGGGTTIEEILFAPMSEDIVRGIRIKVLKNEEQLERTASEEQSSAKISVFSNVDYLIGRFNDAKKAAEEKKKDEDEHKDESKPVASTELQEEVSFVWEVNGRCTPHRVWVYSDGESPENGLCIKVDRFGAAKIVSGDEAE